MELTCESLGITPSEIAEKVAQKIAERMLAEVLPGYDDETGQEVTEEKETRFQVLVRKRVAAKVSAAVDAVADQVLGCNLDKQLASLTFPQTNAFGEHKKEPLTLLEYIARRVDTYLTERVDMDGRSSSNSYSDKSQTRVTWMVDKHLAWTIQSNMEAALKEANAQIVGGIAETVKLKLADIAAKLKISVTTR